MQRPDGCAYAINIGKCWNSQSIQGYCYQIGFSHFALQHLGNIDDLP